MGIYIVLVAISYDRKTKAHLCKIERLTIARQTNRE